MYDKYEQLTNKYEQLTKAQQLCFLQIMGETIKELKKELKKEIKQEKHYTSFSEYNDSRATIKKN